MCCFRRCNNCGCNSGCRRRCCRCCTVCCDDGGNSNSCCGNSNTCCGNSNSCRCGNSDYRNGFNDGFSAGYQSGFDAGIANCVMPLSGSASAGGCGCSSGTTASSFFDASASGGFY
ncbi:hypothetical protein DW757_08795 [Clostridium sp. AM29-11AC]|uniref:hypothetical protein n=1 Tax=Clostridium sp. AM29-11AC TaxID=2293028 RepID=UPI000E4B3879|nr:hypothetical protein [Clostridium sp. AM29-11AC]MBS5469949.1 hypothetical protein [Clostridium sp.]RHT56914.1 hypothetical protein DW757_08795 [Clostridium sp. AM29-11AC]